MTTLDRARFGGEPPRGQARNDGFRRDFGLQVLLIILVAVVLLPQASSGMGDGISAAVSIGLVLSGTALLLLLAVINSKRLLRRLAVGDPGPQFERATRQLRLVQWVAVGIVVAGVLLLGFRDAVQAMVGDVLILDEIITIAPALVAITAAWWIFHPFEHQAREATLLRRLDDGLPIHPIPTRVGWVSMQVRTQMLIILLPLGLLAVTGELVRLAIDASDADLPEWVPALGSAAMVIPIALAAPGLVVRVLGARPFPEGEIRSTLLRMCVQAKVPVREILLWPTGGSMVNAGVTGFIGPLRWVLLTDGLIDTLRREQVMAVMAHELAHARRHHMPWMAVALIALAMLCAEIADPFIVALRTASLEAGGTAAAIDEQLWWIDIGATVLVLLGTLVGFGWVSRRFERQADAFAAVRMSVDAEDRPLPQVSAAGVDAMRSALMAVAGVNGVAMKRFTWRHGSIDARRRHLLTLLDRPIDRLPIDRVVRAILAVAVLVVAAVLLRWSLQDSTIFQEAGADSPAMVTIEGQ
jgi:STE24 endopeptidase